MIYHGDLFDVCPMLDANSIDACVTDPPYGIGFMNKKWDSFKPGAEAERNVPSQVKDSNNPNLKGRTRSPASSPSAVEYDRSLNGQREFQAWTEQWARAVYRILKPGAYLVVCGAPRSFHRMTCGLEDAGFVVRDCLSWLYGQGFPKSLDVSKAIDKSGGMSPHEQSVLLRSRREAASLSRSVVAERIGCTEASVRDWEEGRARETGKALEWIVPSDQYRVALANLLGYSADERIAIGVTTDRRGDNTVIGLGHSGVVYGDAVTDEAKRWQGWGTGLKPGWEPVILARKPLDGTVADNILKHGTGALNIDGCRIEGENPTAERRTHGFKKTDEKAVQSEARGAYVDRTDPTKKAAVHPSDDLGRWPPNVLLDEEAAAMLDAQTGEIKSGTAVGGKGNASSIYGTVIDRSVTAQDIGYGDTGGASRFFYVAKPSRAERDEGCEDLPARTGGQATDREDGSAGVNNPRAGAGRTGGARNIHPTIKPIALMQWLVKLITPEGGTVLDPFLGSGTTLIACRYEGVKGIGIEKEADYVEISRRRITSANQLFCGEEEVIEVKALTNEQVLRDSDARTKLDIKQPEWFGYPLTWGDEG